MNVFAFVSLLASETALFMGIFVFRRNPRNVLNRVFFLYCLSGAYCFFTEFGYRQADSFDTAFLWMKIGAFWPFLISLLLHFVMVFTEKSKLLENKLIYLAIYVPSLVLSLLDLTTNLTTEPVKVYWGWTYGIYENILIYLVTILWAVGIALLSAYLSLRYYLKITEHKNKQKVAYGLIGVFLPISMGILTEGLLPNLGIRIPELTSMGFFGGNFFLGYAIWKYKLFVLTAATAVENIISTMADALILVNMEGKIVAVNQATLKLLGYEESELIDQPVEIIFAQEEKVRTKEAWLEQLMTVGSISDIETTFKMKDAREIPISLSASLMRDEYGTERGIIYVGRDLTERKRIAIEKARLFDEVTRRLKELYSVQEVSAAVVGELELESVLHLIAEKVSDLTKAETTSVCLVSADNRSRNHVASYGVNADMLQGKSLPLSEGRHGWVIRTGESLLSHNSHKDERTSSLGLKIGARSEIIAPLKVKGKVIGCLSAINKRENQHFTEDDLNLLILFANQAGIAIENARLYKQQKDISEELQKSYALLDQKNKELESFVYTVSHDLRAPLVSLEGFASMLLDKYKESLDETGQLYLCRIQANVEKMGDLIQDLLELSRIGRIVHPYQSVDVTEIIQEAIETLQIQLLERGTEWIIQQDLPTITCDRARIKQVFENLIDNANKFMGEENQKPIIEIGFHAESPDADGDKGDFFEFFVKDNGIGINKEYHEKVFEIFRRLGDVDVEGTGVGLAIVKKIIETHGGKIWIDSEVEKGTTVYFTLPKTR